jgi:hypothetical protein
MTSSKEPKAPDPTKFQHGVSSPNPRYPRMSLEEARKLGLSTEPVLIISPMPRATNLRSPRSID